MKKGYYLDQIADIKDGAFKFTFSVLIREKKDEVAGLLVTAVSDSAASGSYICIPYSNADLMRRYFRDLAALDQPMRDSYTRVISAFFAQNFYSSYTPGKKRRQ